MTAIFAILFSVYWFIFLQVPRRYPYINFKPFNCEICLPVWVAGLAYLIPDNIIAIAVNMLGAGVLTAIIIRLMNKI